VHVFWVVSFPPMHKHLPAGGCKGTVQNKDAVEALPANQGMLLSSSQARHCGQRTQYSVPGVHTMTAGLFSA